MPAPAAPIIDSFNRANEDPATGWTDFAAGMKVDTNELTGDSVANCKAYPAGFSVSTPCEFYWTHVNEVAGASVLEVYYLLTNNGGGPIADASKNCYQVLTAFPAATDLTVRRLDNNTPTLLKTWTWAWQNGDKVWVNVQGATHTVYTKHPAGEWTSLGAFTDSTYTTGTIAVATDGNGTARYDDVGGGSVSVPKIRVIQSTQRW